MARSDSSHTTRASAPSRRGLLQASASAAVVVATGAPLALAAAAPVCPVEAEFRTLVAESDRVFALADVLPETPESVAARSRYEALEKQIEAVGERILAQPGRTWADVQLRAEVAAHVSEFGPKVFAGHPHDFPLHTRVVDDLIRSILAVSSGIGEG